MNLNIKRIIGNNIKVKHILGGLYLGNLYSEGLTFGGHFVLVSACQDVENLLLYQQNVSNIGQNDLS